MKRLVKYPIEAGALDVVSRLLRSIFNHAEHSLDIISQWAEAAADESGNGQAAASLPKHVVLNIMPAGDIEDWDESPIYKMLVKRLGEDEDYVSVRFDMKSPDGSNTASDTATYKQQGEDESDEDVEKRGGEMIRAMATKLLKRCSGDDDAEVADIADGGAQY